MHLLLAKIGSIETGPASFMSIVWFRTLPLYVLKWKIINKLSVSCRLCNFDVLYAKPSVSSLEATPGIFGPVSSRAFLEHVVCSEAAPAKLCENPIHL